MTTRQEINFGESPGAEETPFEKACRQLDERFVEIDWALKD